VITSEADADAAQSYSEITGDLSVAASYEGVLELLNLVGVGGSVTVESPLTTDSTAVDWVRITELRLPNLVGIGGRLYLYLTMGLVETDFRSLETIGEEMYIHRNLGLRRMRLDSLTECPYTYFGDTFELPRCEIDAICAIGSSNCETGREGCTCPVECGLLTPHC
jgi:hypothetical protein